MSKKDWQKLETDLANFLIGCDIMWKNIIKKYVGKCKIKGCKNQANPNISYFDDGAGSAIAEVMRARGLPYEPHHFCKDHQDDFLGSQVESLMAGRYEPEDMGIIRQIANEYKHLNDLEPLEEGE